MFIYTSISLLEIQPISQATWLLLSTPSPGQLSYNIFDVREHQIYGLSGFLQSGPLVITLIWFKDWIQLDVLAGLEMIFQVFLRSIETPKLARDWGLKQKVALPHSLLSLLLNSLFILILYWTPVCSNSSQCVSHWSMSLALTFRLRKFWL